MPRRTRSGLVGAILAASTLAASSHALEFSEVTVAGGAGDFLEVRHLKLRGTNAEIGGKLARIAYLRHRCGPRADMCPEKTREQRRYFEMRYPVHFQRMRGVADAFARNVYDDDWNFASLPYGAGQPGCSLVFYPPGTTLEGTGVLSHNFDLSAGTFQGERLGEGYEPAGSRPYVVEVYPDEGYDTLFICCFELLGGACEGINSEGLTVAMLFGGNEGGEQDIRACRCAQAGLNELQVVRYLLDTCADVEEAVVALQEVTMCHDATPGHYVVADRHGQAFLWEQCPQTDHGRFLRATAAEPLVSTEFLQHRYANLNQLPADDFRFGPYDRFRELRKRIASYGRKFDVGFIKETSQSVAIQTPITPESIGISPAPTRTLWHSLYYPERRTLEVDFYLGEDQNRKGSPGGEIRRSGYYRFSLTEGDKE